MWNYWLTRCIELLAVMALMGVSELALANDVSSFNCELELNKGYPMKPVYLNSERGRILVLVGGFARNSHEKMRPYIRQKNYTEVWLCSGGGAVVAGKGIGKLLNSVKATVRIPAGYFCASSCTIATMGGYMRFIDDGAQFVTHASSSFAGFGFERGNQPWFLIFDCFSHIEKKICKQISELTTLLPEYKSLKCKAFKDVADSIKGCTFFQHTDRRQSVVAINAIFLAHFKMSRALTKLIIGSVMQRKLKSEVELLEYFQLMLVDGQWRYVKSNSYRAIIQNFKVTNFEEYCLQQQCDPNFERYHQLLLAIELKDESAFQQVFAIWQNLLTEAELSVKDQLTTYIEANEIALGSAQKNAMTMFDAMRTCRIQSSCQLEQHNLQKLGYDNAF